MLADAIDSIYEAEAAVGEIENNSSVDEADVFAELMCYVNTPPEAPTGDNDSFMMLYT